MVNSGNKVSLRGLERIVGRHLKIYLKISSCIGSILGSLDDYSPVGNIISNKTNTAVLRRVVSEIG
jgi:hypothetical protein